MMKESKAWELIADAYDAYAHGETERTGTVESGLCNAAYGLEEAGRITKETMTRMRFSRLEEHWPAGCLWWWPTDREGAACRVIMAQIFAEIAKEEGQ